MLTLSLFDPAGWRGSGHRHGTQHDIIISPDTASPGYLAGPLPPGTWQVVVDTHMIMPGQPCAIRVDIAASATAAPGTKDNRPLHGNVIEATGSRPFPPLRASAIPTTAAGPAPASALDTNAIPIAAAEPAPASPLRAYAIPSAAGPAPVSAATPRRGPGWYRGDLHAHSIHSDAAWDIPDLLAWSRKRGLDFATLSDHNTISGLAHMDASGGRPTSPGWSVEGSEPSASRRDASSGPRGSVEGGEPSAGHDLLPMGGMEFTTFWGHALALGIRQWVDWRVALDAGQRASSPPRRRVGDGESPTHGPNSRAMTQLPAEVAALGGLFIIAHPMAVGDPYCTGCQWRYPDMMPGTATAVEVWNSDWRGESRNERGLSLAYEWLNAGHRLALTAGTDNHGRNPDAMHYGFNVVYAAGCTELEILRAVRAGHLYLSSGPTLSLAAKAGSGRAGMGDVLAVASGQNVGVTATWADCPEGAEARLVVDGKPQPAISAAQQGSHTWSLPPGSHWCLLTLRAADGLMLALTNPIFIAHGVG